MIAHYFSPKRIAIAGQMMIYFHGTKVQTQLILWLKDMINEISLNRLKSGAINYQEEIMIYLLLLLIFMNLLLTNVRV